ncbi:hypothetical protein ITI46_32140 [Streptomyces oryzae]|uniref:WXG100 family type VII secretion target n=1 Tax=Streptomyces oryzae TaxID=1434886 RepID=A0ABS3XLH9_9ACTN|nr:hypothetical protein [Streptomyces oryzae]MBO8196257.1 hypothetical protein [Streptomyces oryzae]
MGAMRPGETPQQARARAGRLRQHAGQARTLAGSLASTLDSGVAKASADGVWQGPYAERVTGALRNYNSSLEGMANGLRSSAQRWEHEADLLEKEAAAAGTGGG